MHVLQLRFSLLCRHGYDACPLCPTPGSLTLALALALALTLALALALKHLKQPLDALVPGAQSLLLRVDSQFHFLHCLPQQEQLLGLPLVLRLQPEEILL